MSLHKISCLDSFTVGNKTFYMHSLKKLESLGFSSIQRLPFSLKVLLENLIRNAPENREAIEELANWAGTCHQGRDIPFLPSRVLMQDFTGVPAVVDLAAMRDAVGKFGVDSREINPQNRVDLVIDHSVIVDVYGSPEAYEENKKIEYQRNKERYQFLKWGQTAFKNFRVVPPGAGICHQVNLEHLSLVVDVTSIDGKEWAFPDTLVGTDSHTTMVNGLGVLGWGVGGIEAEAAMLGQPYSMQIPEVVGVCLDGTLPASVTATDLVLTLTEELRKLGVVGKFVEFFGKGLDALNLADRATIANMAPEYGATCGFFPVDQRALEYLSLSGRSEAQINLVKAYCQAQGLWRDSETSPPCYTTVLTIDLAAIQPSLAGPKRPQDRLTLSKVSESFKTLLKEEKPETSPSLPVSQELSDVKDGAVVIAAITSCTNTSNPYVMIGAGLLAKKARAYGLKIKPWVKTSLAPGSQVVTDYLEKTGLQKELDALGFNLVGYGCTTCIGNSGPLNQKIEQEIKEKNLSVASVLSGNRNFEGRVNPLVKANYLASPPLVVAYALAGTVLTDLDKDPIGQTAAGESVYLKDIWPSSEEIHQAVLAGISPQMFKARYAAVFEGDSEWQALDSPKGQVFTWSEESTYVKNPPYFEEMKTKISIAEDIIGARALAILGDSVTTDHISPAGSIPLESPAGIYLMEKGIAPKDFNSYGSRRGNHEVMMRGTFANIRIKNEMVPGVVGGKTVSPENRSEITSIYEAALTYKNLGIPLVVIAGKEYGTGSSRDWAAKGTCLLGVKAVIAESFERIHRSNLIGMGVLPFVFQNGENRKSLGLNGTEVFSFLGLGELTPQASVILCIERENGEKFETQILCRIDTAEELKYFQNGGILPYVIRQMIKQ